MKTEEFKKQILPLKDNLFRVAFRITGDRERAEQVVQEAMLKIWHQRDVWVVIEDLPSYCLMVTRNMALQTIRFSPVCREQFAVG